MNGCIPSVLFSFLEAALKRRPKAIEAEIKQLMSAQLKTHLAVREEEWGTLFQRWKKLG